VDIYFSSKDLEALCSNERVQQRELGAPGSRKLRSRLADLAAAANVGDLVAGRPHSLIGDLAGSYALDLDRGRRLVFEPADNPVPRTDSGAIDWPKIRSIRITYIGNYHA
jgi:proteic killer suppression protein